MPLVGGGPGLRQPVHAEDLAIGAISAAGNSAAINKFYSLPGGETLAYSEMISRIFDGDTLQVAIISPEGFIKLSNINSATAVGTDLRDREIVLGKLFGRLLHLVTVLLTALPILALALWASSRGSMRGRLADRQGRHCGSHAGGSCHCGSWAGAG